MHRMVAAIALQVKLQRDVVHIPGGTSFGQPSPLAQHHIGRGISDGLASPHQPGFSKRAAAPPVALTFPRSPAFDFPRRILLAPSRTGSSVRASAGIAGSASTNDENHS